MNKHKSDHSGSAANAVSLTFLLTKEQAGPFPVATETLWCRPEGMYFRVRNVPFFLDGISFDDVISVQAIDGLYQIRSIITPSANSTIWLYLKNQQAGEACLDSLVALGCGVEGGVLDGYYAVNIPGEIDIGPILLAIEQAEEDGDLAADYPSIRHQTTPDVS